MLLFTTASATEHSSHRQDIETRIRSLQNQICDKVIEMERLAGSDVQFREDEWIRSGDLGGGISRVIQNGRVFEKAGVNISVVHGNLPRRAVEAMKADHRDIAGVLARSERTYEQSLHHSFTDSDGLPFFACGVSVVIHAHSPKIPTFHCNYRYFEVGAVTDGEPESWWIGGGADLTPSYLFESDAEHFHTELKTSMDSFDKTYYPRYKKWCDEYFYLPHRGESRGVGGVFFDDLVLNEAEGGRDRAFEFLSSVGTATCRAYFPVVERRLAEKYTEEEKRWQQLRRGRYVEFNLLYDRGTKFGLNTPNARVESILMSLPLTSRWEYCHEPEKGSEEAKLVEVLRNPREWV